MRFDEASEKPPSSSLHRAEFYSSETEPQPEKWPKSNNCCGVYHLNCTCRCLTFDRAFFENSGNVKTCVAA